MPKKPQSAERSQSIDVSLVALLFPVGLLALGLVLPGHSGWGINAIGAMPQPWPVVILLGGVAAIIAGFLLRNPSFDTPNRWLAALLLAACAVLFYYFRSESLVYGDGFTILGASSPDEPLNLQHQFALQPLSMLANRAVTTIGALFGLSTIVSLAGWQVLGGVAIVAAVFAMAGLLVDRSRRTSVGLLALSSGATLLAFGHIENYTWPTALMLWSIYYQLNFIRHDKGIGRAIGFGLIAAASHLVTIPILFLAGFIVLGKRLTFLERLRNLPVRSTVLLLVVASAAFALLLQIVMRRSPLVPLWPMHDNPYWVLSVGHLIDVANLLAMMTPLAPVALLLIWKRRGNGDDTTRQSAHKHLMVVAVMLLLVAFWVNPEIGAPRDWDLLSFFAFPTNLLLLSLMAQGNWEIARKPIAALLAAVVVLVPHVWLLNHPQVSIEHLNAQIFEDPHYAKGYDKAYRCLSWGVILSTSLDRRDLAEPYYRRRLAADPSSAVAANNIAEVFSESQNYDSASYYYEIALRNDPGNPRNYANLAYAYGEIGRLEEAYSFATRAVAMDSALPLAHSTLGVSLCRLKRYSEGIHHLRIARQYQPKEFYSSLNLGIAFTLAGVVDSSLYYLEDALAKAPPAHRENLLLELAVRYRDLGDPTKSATYAEQFRREFPNSNRLDRMLNR